MAIIKTNPTEFITGLRSYNRLFIIHDVRFTPDAWHRWLPPHTRIIGQAAVDGGEHSKALDTAQHLWNQLLSCGADRRTLALVIGGGSLTDLGGFVASTYKRGIAVAFLPTTIIGMVDAAIGGKNGLNWAGVKNQIGTFHEPEAVGIDLDWLRTLPEEEQVSGWMEMVKHSFIAGRDEVERAMAVRDLAQIPALISDAAAIKGNIVQRDPHEAGLRKTLNLGHTVGHALEALALNRGARLPHGIAVGFGLGFTLIASEALAGLAAEAARQGLEHMRHWLRDTPLPAADAAELWDLMQHDKKNEGGQVLEVWLKDWGQAVWDQPLKKEDFQRLWLKTVAEFTA